jgi:hypothetical protein
MLFRRNSVFKGLSKSSSVLYSKQKQWETKMKKQKIKVPLPPK